MTAGETEMKIQSRLKEYEVMIEEDALFFDKLCAIPNSFYVIDQKVYQLYRNLFCKIPEERLCVLEATEENKVMGTALGICERITELPAKRNASLISVGGGIIQDITGFVANVIYRGIRWIFVPTTLLAACDSCIGGKTSLNYKKFKNLLGTFYPPDVIHIYTKMFQTLTEKDYKSGLGEVIKFNIMAGKHGLENIEGNIPGLLKRDLDTIGVFVESSLSYKREFIEADEFDRGERVKLNFAHTFGHAIEVVTNYAIPHGTAVAIGMIMANHISQKRGYLPPDIVKRSEAVLLQVIDIEPALLNRSFSEYMKAIRKDKKQESDSLTAVLITSYGDRGELTVMHNITESEIQSAINYFLLLYGERG